MAVHAFQHNIDLIFDFFSKELKAAGSTLDKLLAYPRGFRKIYRMILSYGGCPILNTAVEADDTHAVLRKMAVDVLAKWKKSIISLITGGIEEGVFDPATNAQSRAPRSSSPSWRGAVSCRKSPARSRICSTPSTWRKNYYRHAPANLNDIVYQSVLINKISHHRRQQ